MIGYKSGTMRNCESGRGGDAVRPFFMGRAMARRTTDGTIRVTRPRVQAAFHWTGEKRARFLTELAATCNVQASCAAAGMSRRTAYALRVRDEQFAAHWRAALLVGYDRLEEALLAAAGAALAEIGAGDESEARGPGGGAATPPFDPELAMRVLDRYRRSLDGHQSGRGGSIGRTTREEAEAALHARLDAYERRRKLRG